MAEKSKYFLLFLSEANKKQLKFLLQHASKAQVLGLREVATNLLQSNVPVDKALKNKLRRYKVFYRELVANRISRCKLGRNSNSIKLLLSSAKSVIIRL